MPELPEVEVVRLGLVPLAGAVVERVDVLDERALTRHSGGAADFERRLTGATLGMPARRGKFLWVPLVRDPLPGSAEIPARNPAESGNGPSETRAEEALLIHLGMSGQVLLREPSRRTEDRHARILIASSVPEFGDVVVVFADQRTFGSLAIDPLVDGAPGQVRHIARDPLDPDFDDRGFIRRLRAKRTEVKRALLDQTLVSGVGNIYADEALWGARIHPQQPTERLSAQAAARLLAEIRTVMERALAEGGTSFDAQYVNVNGQSGYFSRSLRAYGRTGLPCERCGTAIVRRTFMNRSSHLCPRCQRLR